MKYHVQIVNNQAIESTTDDQSWTVKLDSPSFTVKYIIANAEVSAHGGGEYSLQFLVSYDGGSTFTVVDSIILDRDAAVARTMRAFLSANPGDTVILKLHLTNTYNTTYSVGPVYIEFVGE